MGAPGGVDQARLAQLRDQVLEIGERQPLGLRDGAQGDGPVARLRKAGLVTSTRGAHGGYRLAMPAEEITLDVVVEALEGQIAPMECFHETPEGKVLCSHESDGDHACATKLLWTRVQGGVTKALAGTTLEELVDFSTPQGHSEATVRAKAAVVHTL